MLPVRPPSGSKSSVPTKNGRRSTWSGIRTTPARCITDVFQSTTKFAELLVDAMSATELLTAYRIGSRLCDKIVTELAAKAEARQMRTESEDKNDHKSNSEEWNNKIVSLTCRVF
ncbi:hypothetical protein PHET_00255 [Paragonimus heterotremus]|uniref:Uncharacterized protein n=1 Tax=Paragonimus heterotremus TaxID=100268 RepID=A0A8J4SV20_9TREM|nr:hypothetical protein PHET_00255 [Paragonimus heterotremus]